MRYCQGVRDKAKMVLRLTEQNKDEIAGLIAALCHCATGAKAIEFESGEEEPLRMARYLAVPAAFCLRLSTFITIDRGFLDSLESAGYLYGHVRRHKHLVADRAR